MSMTLEQIEEKLAGMNLNLRILVREEVDEWNDGTEFHYETDNKKLDDLVKQIGFEEVSSEPHYDGHTSEYVFKVFDSFVATGYTYSSWDSSEWTDEYEVVEPVEQKVIVYKPVKK